MSSRHKEPLVILGSIVVVGTWVVFMLAIIGVVGYGIFMVADPAPTTYTDEGAGPITIEPRTGLDVVCYEPSATTRSECKIAWLREHGSSYLILPDNFNYDELDPNCARKIAALLARMMAHELAEERFAAAYNGCPQLPHGGTSEQIEGVR